MTAHEDYGSKDQHNVNMYMLIERGPVTPTVGVSIQHPTATAQYRTPLFPLPTPATLWHHVSVLISFPEIKPARDFTKP